MGGGNGGEGGGGVVGCDVRVGEVGAWGEWSVGAGDRGGWWRCLRGGRDGFGEGEGLCRGKREGRGTPLEDPSGKLPGESMCGSPRGGRELGGGPGLKDLIMMGGGQG